MGLFVGRAGELAVLSALERCVLGGRSAAGVVVAEPGLGKSRLLAEVVAGLELPCVRMHGYEPAREIALAAAGGLLRELSRAGTVGEQLGALLLGETGTAVALETVRLFEVASRCVGELGPLAIVADDLQWVDGDTLALLQYLLTASQAGEAALLVLCASRPTQMVEPFVVRLGESVAGECVERIELGPLELEAGVELARRLAPRLTHEAAEQLWRRAQGSPFWLAALAHQGGDGSDSSRLIRSRYASLGADARRLFALLLVAAEPLALADLAEILGWEEARVQRASSELVNCAVAVLDGELRIAHDLIREAATRELPEPERRRLHLRLAEWLERSAGDDVRELLRTLEHHQAAGQPVAELALRIARSPRRRLLGAQGLDTLAEIADAATDRLGAALRREVAALASELGEWGVAFERWVTLADRLSDGPGRAEAALAAATAAFRLGRPAEVHAFTARVRAHAADNPLFAIEADCRDVQALLWLEGRVADAQPLVDRALAAAERLVEQEGSVEALSDAACGAYVRALRGKLDAAIRRADAATVVSCAELIQRSARDPAEVLAAASDAVFSILQFEGLPEAAEPRAARALEEARRLALPSLEVEATHWAGWIAHHRGRLLEARELMRGAVALAERVGPPRRFTLPQLRALLYSVEASLGDWQANLAAIDRAIEAEPDAHYRLVARISHIWLTGRFAAPSRAQLAALLDAMDADAQVAGCRRCLWESVVHGAEAAARLGELDLAEAALERWDAEQPRPGPAARRAYISALLAARHEPQASLPLFAHAAQLAQQAGHDLMRLWIELDLAAALAKLDHDRAIVAFERVVRDAEAMAALSERQLALQQLRMLGVRTWRRGPAANGGELTERELEIAELIVAGANNPEIARTLFLSRKTVERHVSNILAKLGARNRAELAALLARKSEGVPR